MKRFLTLVLFVLVALGAFAEGTVEQSAPRVIRVAWEGADWKAPVQDPWFQGGWLKDNLIPKFERETGIKVIAKEYPTNKPELQDADLKSDEPFDVFTAYSSRVSRLRDLAVDLHKYVPKYVLAKFVPEQLAQWEYNGKLFALPHAGWTAFFCVDKTIADEVGFTGLPADENYDRSWSLDQFNDLIRLVKAQGKAWGSFLFAGDRNGDYWSAYGWIAAFGGRLYKDGQVAFDSPENRAALKYMKWLRDQGYVPPGIAGYTYKDLFDYWKRNEMATCGGNIGFVAQPGLKQQGVDAGLVKELHKGIMMEWPSATGKHVPIMYGPDAVTIIDNGDEQRIKDAELFVEYLTSPDSMYARAGVGKWVPLFDPRKPPEPIQWWKQTDKTMKVAGVFDMAAGQRGQTELRNLWASMLQGYFNGNLTLDEAVAFFTKGAREIISR